MTEKLIIDLMRHGDAEGSDCYRGHTDFPLSEKGEQQMAEMLSHNPGWQQILYSPLQRCRLVGKAAAGHFELPSHEEIRLKEYFFGEWDGIPYEQVWQHQPQQAEKFLENPEKYPPPGGETIAELMARVESLQSDLINSGREHLLLVTHGGVIRAWLGLTLQIPPSNWNRMTIKPASISRIQIIKDDGRHWPTVEFVGVC